MLAALVVGAAAPAVAQSAKSSDQIFQEVFGKKGKTAASAVRAMTVPVVVDEREVGTVAAKVADDPQKTTVDRQALLDALRPVVRPDLLDHIRSQGAPDGFVAVGTLSGPGADVRYEPSDVALVLRLDPAARRAVDLDLGGAYRPPIGNSMIRPATLSAITNISVNEEWVGLSDKRAGAGRGPLNTAIAQSFNLDGSVLEGSALYREDGLDRWQRGDLRLTRDWPDERVRTSAGDLVFSSTGFQSSQSIGGIVIDRNFLLQPYTSYQPTGQEQFLLTSPSTVDVMVNGRPARTYRLSAGSYNLNNFPGTLGTNDVTIRITDEFGRINTINVPFFFDNQLLGEGVHDFSYAAGLPSTTNQGVYRYEHRPLVSARHRIGVTEQLTLGLNAQGDRRQRMVGGEILATSILGTIGIEPAMSTGSDLPRDYAARLSYRDFVFGSDYWKQRTVTASATWRGAGFAPLGTTTPSNPTRLDLAARIGQPLANWITASIGGRYQFSRVATSPDTSNVEFALRGRVTDRASFDVSVEHNTGASSGTETAVYASLRIQLAENRQSVGANVDTSTRQRQLDWRYRSLETADNLDAGFRVGKTQDGRSAEGDASYVNQRFIASARSSFISHYDGAQTDQSPQTYDRRTALSFGTALVFADGAMGVSRPVSDSFAIITPHPRLEGSRVVVDPYNDSYAAQSDFLGAPVLSNLTAYRQRALLLEVPGMPVSVDLGNDRPVIVPEYRSGLIVPIGADATATLSGRLKDASGAVLGLQSGFVRPVDGGTELPFFSNRQGRFRVEGLRPGAWQFVVYGMEDRSRTVQVPADADGVIDLGDVTP